ncbi:hypothetical protein [Yoonia sp. R2-816]|uniref:hypothetical protein n=1 Tax=Yoonia sp. R2-816 TaxID=3342638 RepID=UPI00372A1105
MHAASLTSWRLQALIKVLSDGHPHSTKEIARKSKVLAISACVSELRQHGAEIICERKMVEEQGIPKWVFFYTMLEAPRD